MKKSNRITKDDIKKFPQHIQDQINAVLETDIGPPQKESKMNNKFVEYDGIKFRSMRECGRYRILKFHEKLSIIRDLRLQVPYKLMANDKLIETYYADFVYFDTITNTEIVEDSKGMRTPTYKRKKKWMLSQFNITIKET